MRQSGGGEAKRGGELVLVGTGTSGHYSKDWVHVKKREMEGLLISKDRNIKSSSKSAFRAGQPGVGRLLIEQFGSGSRAFRSKEGWKSY